jgi:hypothetical protein
MYAKGFGMKKLWLKIYMQEEFLVKTLMGDKYMGEKYIGEKYV